MTTPQLEAFREVYGVDVDPDNEPVEFFMVILKELNNLKVKEGRNYARRNQTDSS